MAGVDDVFPEKADVTPRRVSSLPVLRFSGF